MSKKNPADVVMEGGLSSGNTKKVYRDEPLPERSARDLRNANDDIDRVKTLAANVFGFQPQLVVPLECDGNDVGAYCMFDVLGIQYQVHNGVLSIYEQPGA